MDAVQTTVHVGVQYQFIHIPRHPGDVLAYVVTEAVKFDTLPHSAVTASDLCICVTCSRVKCGWLACHKLQLQRTFLVNICSVQQHASHAHN